MNLFFEGEGVLGVEGSGFRILVVDVAVLNGEEDLVSYVKPIP